MNPTLTLLCFEATKKDKVGENCSILDLVQISIDIIIRVSPGLEESFLELGPAKKGDDLTIDRFFQGGRGSNIFSSIFLNLLLNSSIFAILMKSLIRISVRACSLH